MKYTKKIKTYHADLLTVWRGKDENGNTVIDGYVRDKHKFHGVIARGNSDLEPRVISLCEKTIFESAGLKYE